MYKIHKSINSYLEEGYEYAIMRGSKIKELKKDDSTLDDVIPSGYVKQPLVLLKQSNYVIVENIENSSLYSFHKDNLKYTIIDENYNIGLVDGSNTHASFFKVFGFSSEEVSLYNPSYNCEYLGLITQFDISSKLSLEFLFKGTNSILVTNDLSISLKELRKNKKDGHFNSLVESLNSNSYSEYKNVYGYPYSISDMSQNAKNLYKIYPKVTTEKKDELLYKLIKPYSYGIEVETSNGSVPISTLLSTDYVFLRDGSISGYEFTSLPFFDGSGISKTRKFLESASKNCSINQFCSLHIHLGNVPTDKKSIVALYKTIYQTQQELFDFVPNYKRELNYFTSKQQPKDHCRPLKSLGLYSLNNVEEMYSSIFNFVTSNNNDEMLHSSKWNQFPRYHHLNLLNLFNSTGTGTIEYRLHEPTLNFYKIISWLLIISALTKYSEKFKDDIINNKIKISLRDVIIEIYPEEVAMYLIKYIKERTIYFSNRYCSGNYEDYNVLNHSEDKKVFKKEEFEKMIFQVPELT